jgi:hypothetical protein
MVPTEMKDNMVDVLMGESSISGFSLSKIQGFSSQNSHFNIKEQVEGYKDIYRFEVLHDSEQTESLLERVKERFIAGKVRYWVTPVLYAS